MDEKKQNEQQQANDEQPRLSWRRPALERLQVSVDTGNGARGSGVDIKPDQIFGGG